ncbi:MAG: c-type cytochrome, partial [Oceanisphaera sp.]|nr:c-type cytochrome [Oceanisphaera sp.]
MKKMTAIAMTAGLLVAASGSVMAADGQAIYKQVCFSCHDNGIAGSPKLGDKAAWAPRIAAGMDSLYANSINGKGAMPPKGGRMDMSDDQIKAAVDYMVSLLHATWNAFIKTGRSGPQSMLVMTLVQAGIGVAILLTRPLPVGQVWLWLLASGAFHTFYKLFLTFAYEHGDLSRVYPIARGAAPMMVTVISAAFALSGLLAGVAAVLWVSQRASVDPLMGFTPVLKAFIAAILGGLGSLRGAVAGGFLLGFIEVFLA